MGKRKLRFVQRKNYERKRQKLVVSIPLEALPEPECVVSFPLSVYFSAETSDQTVLYSRLSQSQVSSTKICRSVCQSVCYTIFAAHAER